MLSASAIASRSAFLASCWVAVGWWFARCASRFGRIASDSAGAPPPSEWVDLRVRALVSSRRAVHGVAPSLASVLASAGRRSGFGFFSLGLRVAGLPVSGSRVMRGVAACGSRASAVTSALTIRPSRRRFAARLNSGVMPQSTPLPVAHSCGSHPAFVVLGASFDVSVKCHLASAVLQWLSRRLAFLRMQSPPHGGPVVAARPTLGTSTVRGSDHCFSKRHWMCVGHNNSIKPTRLRRAAYVGR